MPRSCGGRGRSQEKVSALLKSSGTLEGAPAFATASLRQTVPPGVEPVNR